MPTTTPNLGLTKPAFNEYYDSWDEVANANYDIIDAAVGDLQTLTAGAAGAASPATIHQRFTDVEGDVAALVELNEIKAGWGAGTPGAGQFLGPSDATSGQQAAGRALHNIHLQLHELTGLSVGFDIDAGVAARLQGAPQGILTGAAGTLISFNSTTQIDVDPGGNFEVLVDGVYGIIRGGSSETLAAGSPAANQRYYLLATSVGWETVAGNTNGSTSGSDMTGTIAGTEAKSGDLVEITAGDNELVGLYVINTIAVGAVSINGVFPKAVSGVLSFQFRRRRKVTLSLARWGTDIDSIVNGMAYLGTTKVGAALGHVEMTGASIFDFAAKPQVQYPVGMNYDSGWAAAATFFDGNAMTTTEETFTVPLPDIPQSWQLLWSASADGSNAIPVPLEANGGAFGVRQWWNRNILSVIAPTAADVMQDTAGAALDQTAIDAGYFRLIAKG